jgi:hypothetical protein
MEPVYMTYTSSTAVADGRVNFGGLLATRLLWLLAAIVVLAAAVQINLGVNTDTSWNITLAEKMLAGQRPYGDFVEINPPASFLLCLAPTLVAQWVGASPEFMVDLFCFAAAGFSLWLAGLILVRAGVIAPGSGASLTVVACTALLLLPSRSFAQREHIALMGSLPGLAALAVWATRQRVGLALGLLAGLSVGVALSIKPHFALFFLFPLVYLARRTGWRAMVVHRELYVALALAASYWVMVAVCFPAYFEHAAPIARDVYLPVRRPLADVIVDPILAIWLALGVLLVFVARRRLSEPLIAAPALAAIGAMGAYLIQGKLWPYQGYPAIAFMALAIGPLIIETLAPRGARAGLWPLAGAAAAAVALIAASFWLASGVERPALERAVAALAPHPKLIVIGSDIAIGHPLTRRVHGVWVGSLSGLWITDMASHALEKGASAEAAHRYQAYLESDRETLVSDIARNRPDGILIAGSAWAAWAQSHADVAAALADYHLRETADGIMVYVLNDGAR